MTSRPEAVGILAIEIYTPALYVDQAELEAHDGVSAGKYTIGLGQDGLGFCSDHEDVISMSLTVVQQLLEKHNVDPARVGRLEVGSETVIDKSKSIKSALMRLFEPRHNSDIEGVDSTNACYGGTAALQNSLNWVESSGWDGRYAIVVATDTAVYAQGPARPTGGAGAVAMLIGAGAPIALERGLTATYAADVYDFYKPNLASEYPVVDGKLSQTCYLRALDQCYAAFCAKYEKRSGKSFSIADGDYFVFHSPYNKAPHNGCFAQLVQKSFARLLFLDYKRFGRIDGVADASSLDPYLKLSEEESYEDRGLEKAVMGLSKPIFANKAAPGTMLPKAMGNTYTASLYTSLASLLSAKGKTLEGKRIVFFSYGSGLVASMFSARVGKGEGAFTLENATQNLGLEAALQSRRKVPPSEFVDTLELMETRYGANDFVPSSPLDTLRPSTYFLTKVDSLHRRSYARKPDGRGGGGEVLHANGHGVE